MWSPPVAVAYPATSRELAYEYRRPERSGFVHFRKSPEVTVRIAHHPGRGV